MKYRVTAILIISSLFGYGKISIDSTKLLLENLSVQIEATSAIDAMYNFDFEKSSRIYRKLYFRYPSHPLSHFLLGMNIWWKIMPDEDNEKYDKEFLAFMDATITRAEIMLEHEDTRVEGSFFLAAAYGFKGRLYSNRRSWKKAALSGKNAISNIQISKKSSYLSPELLFGEALYNYYSVWIPENYKFLKPIMLFFPEGNKELGLSQLKKVSQTAFYTRIEGQVFLMQILANDYNDYSEALRIAEYLYEKYPNNPIFHRRYLRYLYSTQQHIKMISEAKLLLNRIDIGTLGYEATSGRYASFFLAQYYERENDLDSAHYFYKRAEKFGEKNEAYETGYFLYSLLSLGNIAKKNGDYSTAKKYFRKVKKYAKRDTPVHEKAKNQLKRK